MFTNSKMIISGNIIELFSYEDELWQGTLPQGKLSKIKGRAKSKDGKRSQASFYRAKGRVRHLIDANIVLCDKKLRPRFVTFTFRENIKDIKIANFHFTTFIRKFKYFLKTKNVKLKYVTVIEFQKRGAVHYHTLFFNLPYFANMYDVMEEIWGHGYVISKKIDRVRSMSSYMCKYMIKEMNDNRLYGQKCYFTSMGMKQPRTIYNESYARFVSEFMPEDVPLYEKISPNNHCGTIYYRRYDLSKHEQAKDDLLAFIK